MFENIMLKYIFIDSRHSSIENYDIYSTIISSRHILYLYYTTTFFMHSDPSKHLNQFESIYSFFC